MKIPQSEQNKFRVRSGIMVGKTCDLDMNTWWQCYTGWLNRGGGFGKPDPQYYQCKKTCNN